MAIRNLRYRGDAALRKTCRYVPEVTERIRDILDDMMDTLHSMPNGAALAANQVGILKRLVVIDYQDYCLKLVNPEIIGKSGVQECFESCLSFPEIVGKTIRPQEVTIQALDENGRELLLTGQGEMAKCFCHEIEHLDGVIFLDKIVE